MEIYFGDLFKWLDGIIRKLDGLEEVCGSVMGPLRDVLKPGGYACVVAPDAIPLEGLAADAGFKVVEVHLERVHGSLTRKIVVGKK